MQLSLVVEFVRMIPARKSVVRSFDLTQIGFRGHIEDLIVIGSVVYANEELVQDLFVARL